MIISLRGTNGAGKSHLVRRIMELHPEKSPEIVPWRKRPRGYELGVRVPHDDRCMACSMEGCSRLSPKCECGCHAPHRRMQLYIPGHYEPGVNGGVDTLGDLDETYDLIAEKASRYMSVLYEGKNLTDRPRRLLEIAANSEFTCYVVELSTSLEECVASVRARGHKIKEETIARLHRKSREDCEEFARRGIQVFTGDRDECFMRVREMLGV